MLRESYTKTGQPLERYGVKLTKETAEILIKVLKGVNPDLRIYLRVISRETSITPLLYYPFAEITGGQEYGLNIAMINAINETAIQTLNQRGL